MSAAGPRIETARLILRPHRGDDLAAMQAMWGDPEITRFIGGVPSREDEVWARLLRYVGHWTLHQFGLFAVEERSSGRFVGETGCAWFRRGLGDRFDEAPEAGWVFCREVHGTGYAQEALEAALDWSARARSIERTVCMIDVENQASIGLAARAGYVEFTRLEHRGRPIALFER